MKPSLRTWAYAAAAAVLTGASYAVARPVEDTDHVQATPEPSVILMLVAALVLGVGYFIWRRRHWRRRHQSTKSAS